MNELSKNPAAPTSQVIVEQQIVGGPTSEVIVEHQIVDAPTLQVKV
jgi:hypothetical protein